MSGGRRKYRGINSDEKINKNVFKIQCLRLDYNDGQPHFFAPSSKYKCLNFAECYTIF